MPDLLSIEKFFLSARVFVTGGSGFIASHLISSLRKSGSRVVTFDQIPRTDHGETTQVTGDLNDYPLLKDSLERSDPDIIFHLAASKKRSLEKEDFEEAIRINVNGALNLFNAAAGLKRLKRFIVLGTAEEYGNNPCPFKEDMPERPVSSYSFTKMCVTRLCRMLHKSRGLPFVLVRPTLAFGPGQGTDMFLPALISAVLQNREFSMTRGEQTRDFIYVEDLVEGMIKAAYVGGAEGEIINLGSGNPLRIRDAAEIAAGLLGAPDLLRIGALEYRRGEIMDYYVDNSKARTLLGWNPNTEFKSGLQKTIDYYAGLKS